ncbi:MAG TPA: hypothetical protein DCP97_04870 [Ruminococcaceae bacterium]|jgi:hypothetical protein|nr:hypothetical protein [Oscillospiraceae bacterium]
MSDLIENMLTALLRPLLETLSITLTEILKVVMYAENSFSDVMTQDKINRLTLFIYGFGVSLIIIKTLKKGFFVYILWRDGDADSSPIEMTKGALLGTAYALVFPTAYKWFADIFIFFCSNVLNIVASDDTTIKLQNLIVVLFDKGIIIIALTFVYAICILILWIQLAKRGIEMFILRMGFPIACVGLVDSDSGVFKPYIKTFLQTAFTTIIQMFSMYVSYLLMINLDFSENAAFILVKVIFSLAFLLLAFSAPKLMQSLLIPTGGDGIGNKLYMTTNIVRSFSSFIK